MRNSKRKAESRKPNAPRGGFTLMELLIVMLIIAILAGLALAALQGATEQAREARTRAIVAKIDQLIGDKWESYRTRSVPIRLTPNTDPLSAARARLYALRELQRMELPDRRNDVWDSPTYLGSAPGANRAYRRKMPLASWTDTQESAECLYAILATMKDGDKSALEFFMPDEIGDEDGDGFNEIHDAWGQPIRFIRWPAGYLATNGATTQTSNGTQAPDPFDPVKADPRARDTDATNDPYEIRPLIVSGGPDKAIDLEFGNATTYTSTGGPLYPGPLPPADPYRAVTPLVGTPQDNNSDGDDNSSDNITNHYQPNG